ncbi:protein of unknown function [Methanoculleus bourgensis]|uniref:Uncharacterized protein n=1 Tax=Methanoculleus bourgensis TaxID=83986 RepID=A0A0X3BR88_9EURY|nr:protein of unknown function [Methanoculleus bourgensis]
MGTDYTTITNFSIITNCNAFRMYSIKDYIIAYIDIFTNIYSPHLVETNSPRGNRKI